MESGRKRRSFPDAFKLEAVAAVRGGRTAAQVAAELGLPDRLVRAWLRWAETRSAGGMGAAAARPSRQAVPPSRRAPARPTRRPKSPGYAANSIACGWSATS
jgi:transposase